MGVGGPAGGAPARLVGTTPHRRPAAPCCKSAVYARRRSDSQWHGIDTCKQCVLDSLAPVLDGPDGPQDARWAGHIPHSHVRLRRPGRRAVRDRPVVGPAGPRFFRSGLARTGSTCDGARKRRRPRGRRCLTIWQRVGQGYSWQSQRRAENWRGRRRAERRKASLKEPTD